MKTLNIKNKNTFLMVLSAVLWLIITIMGWTGLWFPAMFLGLALMFIYMLLGSAKEGEVKIEFLKYPIIPFIVLWTISFSLSYYWGKVKIPTFTVAGLDPSFAVTFFLYFIGGIITLTIGLKTKSDYWLSDQDWDDFLQKIDKLEKEKLKGGN